MSVNLKVLPGAALTVCTFYGYFEEWCIYFYLKNLTTLKAHINTAYLILYVLKEVFIRIAAIISIIG